jgi:hypothetical protein
MTRRGWILPIALVVAADAVVLLGVARNRTGDAESIVEMTGRELIVEALGEEGTGVALRPALGAMDWRHRNRDEWLIQTRIEDLGYSSPRGRQRPPPRKAYVALEYPAVGPRVVQEATASRLLPVGVGLDPIALRRRFPDRNRFIIAACVVRPVQFGQEWKLHWSGVRLLIPRVHVPLPWSRVLKSGSTKNLAVELRYGRNYEPWVARVRER